MMDAETDWTRYGSAMTVAMREVLELIEADEIERAALVDDAAAFVAEALA